jgi:hypothetical protein
MFQKGEPTKVLPQSVRVIVLKQVKGDLSRLVGFGENYK